MDLQSKKALSSSSSSSSSSSNISNRATIATSLDSLAGDALQQDCGGLAIEDYLDFSNEDFDSGENINCAISIDEAKPQQQAISTEGFRLQKPSPLQIQQNSHSLGFLEGSAGVCCMPCEDIAHLEWLSNFVEESFSSGDGALLLGSSSSNGEHKPEQHTPPQRGDSPVSVLRCGATELLQSRSSSSVHSSQKCNASMEENSSCRKQGSNSNPSRARSKRCRAPVCFWNTRILSLTDDCSILTEGAGPAASASCKTDGLWSSSSSESDAETYWGVTAGAATSKRVKAKTGSKQLSTKVKQGQQQQQDQGERRCLHCGSQRTPQWRAGPMGPKTLCNACGVRYKSGRLLPEYRPAASPTFVESIHSNSHRRVLEMRKQRAETSVDDDRQQLPVSDDSGHRPSVLAGVC